MDETTEPKETRSVTPPAGTEGGVSSDSPPSPPDETAGGADAETLEYGGSDTPQSATEEDPPAIGRYRVIKRIGRGG
jgi:hypothetical protein